MMVNSCDNTAVHDEANKAVFVEFQDPGSCRLYLSTARIAARLGGPGNYQRHVARRQPRERSTVSRGNDAQHFMLHVQIIHKRTFRPS
ncbi:unnamed protein product [Periconia digitata]|uniref:Uncharacterized protein n=1 Tax=Periconia digitata TaxID=1303443 RepID=A0A9W4XZ49_9PLEO|nr:unnamed protein product [Periconia digitata]